MIKLKLFFLILPQLISITGDLQAQDNKKSGDEMKTYYMVFLKEGQNEAADTVQTNKVLEKHMANIIKLYKEGKLVLAGPFLDNTEFKGILILDVETKEEAEKIINADPAVVSGDLEIEVKPWYGPVKLKKLFRD